MVLHDRKHTYLIICVNLRKSVDKINKNICVERQDAIGLAASRFWNF